MAQTFETEIERLLYETLTGDDALATLLGADEMDPRVYLSWRTKECPLISDSKPGYVMIRLDSADQPQRVGGTVDDWRERYLVSLFSLPEKRELRREVVDRFRTLFHRQSFVTESFLVYDTVEIAREERATDDRIVELMYTLSIRFLPR
ncbi:MAG: hypothetical protein JW885_11530 [Deltaproteobacteria bacterium]|nr:hypothetical protein [Candidatus Zymogenaceae bacterium]